MVTICPKIKKDVDQNKNKQITVYQDYRPDWPGQCVFCHAASKLAWKRVIVPVMRLREVDGERNLVKVSMKMENSENTE